VAVILGLASAVVYGAGDFLGGLAARRSSSYAVVVWSQLIGLLVLGVAIAVTREALPPAVDMAWGVLAGVGGGIGVVLLYRGLAIGRMAVVAPTTGVIAASIPVVTGLALGERPAPLALVGVLVALAAIVLVSSAHGELTEHGERRRLPTGLWEGIGGGLGFALFFICLSKTSGAADLWPLVAVRFSIVVATVGAIATRSSLRPAPGSWGRITVVGLLDMAANLLFLLASRQGLLSIVAVLTSLYPASTVLLARVVLHERLSPVQVGGLLAAGAGVVLIAG
jgi:drug/metabolite transporter (DMT)-like permease